jgi:uncharacterized membrane protein (DUF4010 family)
MVVLIVGISLVGYIVYKFFGEKVSTALGGIVGGGISSTATTVSYARQSTHFPERNRMATVVIMTASSIVLVRVLIEIAVVAPGFMRLASPPILVMFAAFAVISACSYLWGRREKTELPPQANPSELKSALMFGLLYAIMILAIAAAKEHFGERGLYVVAALSGMTDMDVITLSTSRLVESARVDPATGWRLIIIALMSNLVFKAVAVALLGHRRLTAHVASLYSIALVLGVMLLVFWP